MSQAQIAAKEMALDAPRHRAPPNRSSCSTRCCWCPAIIDSFRKLNPRTQWRNPVMFVVYVGSIITTLLYVQALFGQGEARPGFILAISIWLWFTVLFANFAEALAEGRSKAQAASLRSLKQTVMAKKLASPKHGTTWLPQIATELRKGHDILVEAGDVIPIDGEVIEGVASVDESAITGESAPVIRESGGDFSSVTGGTRVLSDWLVVRVTANPGETFLDRMIAMVEGAKRQKTPNEIALTILLVALTIVFLIVTVTLLPFSLFSVERRRQGRRADHHHGADRAAGLPDPDHHRRPAVGHRRGRHEPHDAGQRHRHLGPRGRSGRRRRRAAARQDRHHHARQPPGLGLPRRRRASPSSSWPTRATRVAGRRNAGRPQHRGAGQAEVQHPRTRDGVAGRGLRAVLRANAHERRRSRRAAKCARARPTRCANTSSRWASRYPAEVARAVDDVVAPRQHAAGGGRRRPRDGRGRAEGHRQGRHQGALRRAAPHGHQDRDDHRRQQADRRRHRRRSRRRRLPRRGDAGSTS